MILINKCTKRKRLFIAFFLFAKYTIFAQLSPQYSLYMLNPYNYNVAYAGMDNSLSVTGVFRKQWVGLEGSPSTQNLNLHLPFYYIKGGIGMKLENDMLGQWRSTRVMLSYNYIQTLKKSAQLSLGIGGGFVQGSLDGSKLRAPEGEYGANSVVHNDNLLPTTKISGVSPSFSAGLVFKNKKTTAGIGIQDLFPAKISFEKNNISQIYLQPNYFFTFAHQISLNESFLLKPYFLVKTDTKTIQTDVSLLLEYKNNIFSGISFRGYNKNTIDALIVNLGYRINKNITLAYAYDINISNLRSYNAGSHEILLNYNLQQKIGGGILPAIIFNPRF